MTIRVHDLEKKRATAFDAFKALAHKDDKTDDDWTNLPELKRAVENLDREIEIAKEAQRLAGARATPVEGQEGDGTSVQVRERDPYINEDDAKAMGLGTSKGLRAIACVKLFNAGGSNVQSARSIAAERYGERHSITRAFDPRSVPGSRALVTAVGASGGFIVPPDYVNEIIELLRPAAVVRSAGPRVLPMPRGTMTLPGQASAASASYSGEVSQIASSQQTLNQIVASYKKLTALTPVSNDLMRYADPAADAFVRDDLVKVIALREDLAFILGDGTAAAPMGFLYFANRWVKAQGGTVGVWSTTANSTLAVNATDPANTTGGNFISANETYTLATVAAELGGAVNRLDTANVPDSRRVWFMHPRSYNYLFNVQNSLGVYVYREELLTGKLLSYPFKKTTQIGTNYYDANGAHTDCSFIFLVEMDEAIILDSMTLELMVSREGSYVDANSNTVSALQNDQTLIRAIAEHDFQMRHDQSIAVIQNVRYAPAIS
ncbi:MAG TPA: phage major capsid protein [Rhizomicrobium sp.]|nr:phage major capsid protein [Rhizomicrobium sp.]